VRVFYGTEKREREKDSRYIDETSAPAAVTVYQICNISGTSIPVTFRFGAQSSDGVCSG
jgi:hypothetical protein